MGEFIEIAVVILPTVIAVLSAYVSIQLTKRGKYGIAWVAILILGVGASILTGISQSNARKQHDREQRELQVKLDKSLLAHEYTRGQLDTISVMVGRLGQSDPAVRELAVAISKMAASSGVRAHVLSISSPNPGNFQIRHDLGCTPREAVIQMTSRGSIQWQSPANKYDSTNLYLDASDNGLTADVLVWCRP